MQRGRQTEPGAERFASAMHKRRAKSWGKNKYRLQVLSCLITNYCVPAQLSSFLGHETWDIKASCPNIHTDRGYVIRSFGTFNTIKYALNTKYAYNTIVFLSNFGSADFWPKMDPIRPKITQMFSKLFRSIICYKYIIKWHWRLTERPFRGGNCLKRPRTGKKGKFCNRIIRLNSFNTVKYALNTSQESMADITSQESINTLF
jgi:hypothetical protein